MAGSEGDDETDGAAQLTPAERQALRKQGIEEMKEAVRNAPPTFGWTAYAPRLRRPAGRGTIQANAREGP